MVGVVIVTHAGLAEAFIGAVEFIFGPLEQAAAVGLNLENENSLVERISQALKDVDDGDGVIMLTDMFGGTPSNVSLSFVGPTVEVVSGVNLPMLIKLVAARQKKTSLADLAAAISSYGRQNITIASEILHKR